MIICATKIKLKCHSAKLSPEKLSIRSFFSFYGRRSMLIRGINSVKSACEALEEMQKQPQNR